MVPSTVTVHGVLPSGHVVESLMPPTEKSAEVRGLRSAIPPGAEKVVISTMRKRSRVTGNGEVLTIRLRMSSVPNVEVFSGSDVKSRARFGKDEAADVPSRFTTGIASFCCIGLDKFSGPGAPRFASRREDGASGFTK